MTAAVFNRAALVYGCLLFCLGNFEFLETGTQKIRKYYLCTLGVSFRNVDFERRAAFNEEASEG
jgi:hypothetical protein